MLSSGGEDSGRIIVESLVLALADSPPVIVA
jgi:hypothetical protein